MIGSQFLRALKGLRILVQLNSSEIPSEAQVTYFNLKALNKRVNEYVSRLNVPVYDID